MKDFFDPRNVALIGISRKSGLESFNLMEIMIDFGFSGKIFPVNPSAEEILGIKSYPNVRDIGEEIDLAVITTPRQTTLSILEDCVAAGIKAAIVVNQGFNDADSIGKEIQADVADFAKRENIRILGPNTLGVVNCFSNFTTSFMPVSKERTPVGLICQSGIHLVGPRQFSGTVGKGVDLGNACDIGFYDALKYMAEDPDIKIVGIHMEGLNQGKRFLKLLSEVSEKKPIVIHKTGMSATGARAALSHTGSMAGNYHLSKAALEQAGAAVLEEASLMAQAVKTLLYLPAMKGRSVGIITYSGGAGIMASDTVERYGLSLARLAPETLQQVLKLSPEWMPLGNPLDIWPAVMVHGAQKAYTVALNAVLKDPAVDGVLCIAIAPLPEFSFLDVSQTINHVVAEFPNGKPVVGWTYGPNTQEITKRFESKKRIMVYPTLEIATWALSLLRDRYTTLARGANIFSE